MAGRGRPGRGRGLSFSVESLGFGRGESLPGSILQPPPLFPPLEFKPLPLSAGEEYEYLLALKQEFQNGMKDSPYHIKPADKRRDIERYSDKYTLGNQENGDQWKPDWSLLPEELKPNARRKRKIKKVVPAIKPKIPAPTKAVESSKADNITETLEQLEKKEGEQEEEGVKEKKEGEENAEEEEGEEEEDYYEEELEEETDYNLNYFDNGEGFGGDEDDDLDEGPVY